MTKNPSTTWVLTTGTNFRFFWDRSTWVLAGYPLRPGAPALLFQLDCPTALRSWHRVCGSGSPGGPQDPRESKGGLEMTRHWNQLLIYDTKWIQISAAHVSRALAKPRTSTQHREERLRFGQRVGRRSAGQSVNFWGISIAQKIYSKKTHRKQNHTTPCSLLALYHIKNLSYIYFLTYFYLTLTQIWGSNSWKVIDIQ